MPISPDLLRWYLSGGIDNTEPVGSVGGPRSNTAIGGGMNELFDNISGAEAVTGDIEYRCVYFKNDDPDLDGLMFPVKIWIDQQAPSGNEIDIGLDPAGKNATVPSVANENTPPPDVVFTRPANSEEGLELPDSPYYQNEFIAVWIRRTTAAGLSSSPNITAVIKVEGDTV